MATETKLAEVTSQSTEATWTNKPGDSETWVREIMLPHFRILGDREKSVARTLLSARPVPENKIFTLSEVWATEDARRARRRALIFPREHGAWGLLLVPMITGAGVAFREAHHVAPFLLLLTAALALFWLRTPVESLLGTSAMRVQTREERREVAVVIVVLGKIAIVSLAALLWAGRNPYLWLIGAAAVVAFVAQSLLKKVGRRTRMLSEIVGTVGLTLAAPAAYYVITGKLGATAWILWLANLIFAGDQIHFVQLRLHTAKIEGLRAKLTRGWAFAIGQALMTLLLTAACVTGILPKFASLAFAPLLFRGWFYFIQPPAQLVVRQLGWNELAHAVSFCVLFVATFTVAM